MASAAQISVKVSARRFAEGLLAGLAADNERQITANQAQVHRAFRRILSEVTEDRSLNVDLSDVDYDPLYGLSGWLDEFLARAQRDLLISSPNPSYGRIEIRATPAEGEAMLQRYGHGPVFKRLSKRFVEELRA